MFERLLFVIQASKVRNLIIINKVDLFFLHPVAFYLLQRLACGFWNQFPDYQHVGHAHEGEQQECSGWSKILEHPGVSWPTR